MGVREDIANVGRHTLGRFVGVRVGVAFSRNKLALRTRLRNLNLKSKFTILIVSEVSAFILTIFFNRRQVRLADGRCGGIDAQLEVEVK